MNLKNFRMKIKQFEVWIADLNPRFGTETGKTRPVAGSGNAHVFASVHLSASVYGSGDVYYRGNPQSPEIHTAGSGTVQAEK